MGIDLGDVALLTNHDAGGIPLARSPKTLQLDVTETGLEMRAELPDTEQGRSVYQAVKRGDLSQMSFAFDIGDSDFDEATQTRTITKISKIYEISVVNFAVYKSTKVEARKESDNMFNPIESAVLNTANAQNPDTHATPEYRSAFFKSLLGQVLTEPEIRAMNAARAEKRADVFNTLTSSAAVDRKKVTTHNVTFSAYELIKILSMSAAAKRMTISAFESYIMSELRQSIVNALNIAVVSGTGTGQPQGLLTGITWNAQNSKTTTAITSDDLLALIAMLPAGYGGGAKFAMSVATLFGNVYPLKTTDGDYIFTDAESGGVRRLFGFEIVLDDNLSAGTVIFGNFKFYGVNIPEGIAVETSRESGFANGLIDFRALCIADGKVIVPAAFVKLEVSV
jgi:HK97 family phage prohead protease